MREGQKMIDQKKLALIHIIKKELNLSDEEYHRILIDAAGVTSAKDLDDQRFRDLMNNFARTHRFQINHQGMTLRQLLFIKSLAQQLYWEKQHLENFLFKYYHKNDLVKLTREEASKVIESLKHIKAHHSIQEESGIGR